MKILLLGKHGMLGSEFLSIMEEQNIDFQAPTHHELDLLDFDAVDQFGLVHKDARSVHHVLCLHVRRNGREPSDPHVPPRSIHTSSSGPCAHICPAANSLEIRGTPTAADMARVGAPSRVTCQRRILNFVRGVWRWGGWHERGDLDVGAAAGIQCEGGHWHACKLPVA